MRVCSRSGAERGQALLLALIVLVVAATAGTLVSVALSVDLRSERADARRARLAVLTDSALAEALAALAVDTEASGFAAHPLGRGAIESTILVNDDGSRTVQARARYGGVERRVSAEVVLGGRPVIVAVHSAGSAPIGDAAR